MPRESRPVTIIGVWPSISPNPGVFFGHLHLHAELQTPVGALTQNTPIPSGKLEKRAWAWSISCPLERWWMFITNSHSLSSQKCQRSSAGQENVIDINEKNPGRV